MAVPGRAWEISYVASNPEKKAEAERRAREIHARLKAVKPVDLSYNEWARKAKVSTSFFTNLGDKKASEPSIGNLRAVLQVAGLSLPEFFITEARGRVIRPPSRQDVEKAILDALPDMPHEDDARARYLAEVVERVLSLPRRRRETPASGRSSKGAARG